MANTAAQLGNFLSVKADINFYTQQSIYWNARYEANQEQLEKQVKYEEKWESAYDSAYGPTKDIKWKGGQVISEGTENKALASAYADWKVAQYNEELSLELAEMDVEYDTMKTMYDTLLESLRAQETAEKQSLSSAAQDTGLIQG